MSDTKRARTIVVAAIAGTLVIVVVAVLMSGNGRGKGVSRTSVLIKTLAMACEQYRAAYGEYPRSLPNYDSSVLHKYLGSPRTDKSKDGKSAELDSPFMLFTPDILEGNPPHSSPTPPRAVIDEWAHPLRYANPGLHNRNGFDLWSIGDGSGASTDPSDKDFGGIGNWTR